jgi:hypothetical protein
MANTRFFYDPCRTQKQLQQATDPGRWIFNVPGNGDRPFYIQDPQIILQKWGGNLQTNPIELESHLLGYTSKPPRDSLFCPPQTPNSIMQPLLDISHPVAYPTTNQLTTDQPRATHPAWTARDLEQNHRYILPLNPQENTCFPFHNNVSTRIIEKNKCL